MKIRIKVHPNSSQEKIVKKDDLYEVWLKEKAVDGKANASLIKKLKMYFKKDIKIKSGFNSRNKTIEIK